MTNAALQAMIEEYGDRISCIIFDNAYRVLIGYPGSQCHTVSELILTTKGGTDMVGVRSYSNLSADRESGVTYVMYHPTECVQGILVMDDGFKEYRVDPSLIT